MVHQPQLRAIARGYLRGVADNIIVAPLKYVTYPLPLHCPLSHFRRMRSSLFVIVLVQRNSMTQHRTKAWSLWMTVRVTVLLLVKSPLILVWMPCLSLLLLPYELVLEEFQSSALLCRPRSILWHACLKSTKIWLMSKLYLQHLVVCFTDNILSIVYSHTIRCFCIFRTAANHF